MPRKSQVRLEQKSGQTCHTAREQLVFILNEASVGVFQVASSKNSPVTLHSNWQPSGGQRDGVGLGGKKQQHPPPPPPTPTPTPPTPPNMPPLVSVTWHGRPDERKHVWLTHPCLFFLNSGCLFGEVWHLEVQLLTGSQMRRWSRINSLTQRM